MLSASLFIPSKSGSSFVFAILQRTEQTEKEDIATFRNRSSSPNCLIYLPDGLNEIFPDQGSQDERRNDKEKEELHLEFGVNPEEDSHCNQRANYRRYESVSDSLNEFGHIRSSDFAPESKKNVLQQWPSFRYQ
jgi:hypothetical protein